MMKDVVMNQDDIIAWGPQRVFAGETYSLPEEVAASLVGRGLAVYADEKTAAKETPPKADKATGNIELADIPLDLSGYTVSELKELAKEAGITGYGSMNKAELVKALESA